ncbi:MAG: class I SAM-dependent methyltransferase [Verrucomicrobiota bacterium]|jgi:SAM-dependent methyltransferase
MPANPTPTELQALYRRRFASDPAYRSAVWRILISDCLAPYLRDAQAVLDLGCGYGEFINQLPARQRYAMDCNPDAARHLDAQVRLLQQDCASPWPLADNSLDLVFTSNFFEHLPNKASLARTLAQIRRCLKPGRRLVALGPNIKFLPGRYWDFWDHCLPLTELSLAEGMNAAGLGLERMVDRFLPYTMSQGPRYPLVGLRLYLRLPFLWKVFGKQFLVVAVKAK